MNHGAQPDPSAPFEAKAVPQNDLKATVTIQGEFVGLLLYVTKENSKSNMGSFNSVKGFDFVTGCDPEKKSTVTHIDDSKKKDTAFVWTAPEAGSYIIKAIVTGGKAPWNEFNIKIDVAAAKVNPIEAVRKVAETKPKENAKADDDKNKSVNGQAKHSSKKNKNAGDKKNKSVNRKAKRSSKKNKKAGDKKEKSLEETKPSIHSESNHESHKKENSLEETKQAGHQTQHSTHDKSRGKCREKNPAPQIQQEEHVYVSSGLMADLFSPILGLITLFMF